MPSPKDCRVLREKYGDVLKEHTIIEEYLEGKCTNDKLNEFFLRYGHLIIGQVGSQRFFDMERLLFLDTDAQRRQGHTRFSKLLKRLNLDVAPREQKIKFIKKTDFSKFLDILSISNGLLRDLAHFQRWKDEGEDKAVYSVRTTDDLLELWAPVNARLLFKKTYHDMQRSITVNNMNYWAVMMYFTIIAAHLFPDGNGRIARHAYFLLRGGPGVLDEEHTRERVKGIKELCNELGLAATENVCLNHDNREIRAAVNELPFPKLKKNIPSGNFDKLCYVAVRDAVKKFDSEIWTGDLAKAECIGRGHLPRKFKHFVEKRMELLREEWFHAYLAFADAYWHTAQKKLDKMLGIR